MNLKRYLVNFDWLLVMFLIGIMCAGYFTLASVSNLVGWPVQHKQLIWYLIGSSLMIFLAFFRDCRMIEAFTNIFYIGCLILLLFLALHRGGVHRWIHLGFFNLQPSEFTKLAVIMVIAKFFAYHPKERYNIIDLIKPAILVGLPALLIMKQPDLGTAILVLVVFMGMVLFARIDWKTAVVIGVIIIVAVPVAYHFMRPYQRQRLESFLHPNKNKQGGAYHVTESKIAVGTGGVFGQGYKNGVQVHLKFLPESQTDFAFATFAEEWGFCGGVFLIICYIGVLARGLIITAKARSRFEIFLAFGICVLLFCQTVINILMVLGCVPVVGIPLPLVSYGGSSAIVTLASMGILLNIGRHQQLFITS